MTVGDVGLSHAAGHVPGLVIEIAADVTEPGQDLVAVTEVAGVVDAQEVVNEIVAEIGTATVIVIRSVAALVVTVVIDLAKKTMIL